MRVSFNWLKDYVGIKIPLPKLADTLTMCSFEVAAVEKAGSDYVLDIEVLPNRAHDCLSHIGVAREIFAALGKNFSKSKLKNQNSKIKEDKKLNIKNYLNVEVKEPELCRRYVGRVILGVRVGPSPKWLKDRLEAIGQKSINNIVDATNYAMFEFGQPLHAFDLDKVKSVEFPISKSQFPKKIIVRKAKRGEKIVTLDNEMYELNENVLVIADEKEPLAIAGIKGGRKAEIDKNTANIILESANFEPVNIRRTSRALGLRTESSLRFEHEISPYLAEIAMERLAELIQQVAGGKITKGKIDRYLRKPIPYIAVRPGEVERILGVAISEKEIGDIFKRLGFETKKISPLEIIFKTAKGLLGKPYKYGASVSFDAPGAFDCSSFVSYCYSRAGIQLRRLSVEQFIYDGVAVEKDKLQPGDLVFSKGKKPYFYKETPKGVGHVGIYLGNGKVIHASSSRGVVIEPLAKSEVFKEWRGAKRILTERSDLLLTKIPPERLDLRIKEDLIEEVARIRGYENIPAKLPLASLTVPQRNDLLFWERIAKDALAGAGFDEIYNYSFIGEKDIENVGFNPVKTASLLNPVSDEKKFLRPTLLINLLKNVRDNFRFFDEARMFEIGKIFGKSGTIAEKRMLAGVVAYKSGKGAKGREFYELKGAVDALFDGLGIAEHWYDDFEPRSDEAPQGFWKEGGSAEIKVGDKHIGYLGEISPSVLEKYDIKTPVAGFEIDFEILASLAEEEQVYYPISKYPAIVRDLAILLPLEVRVEEVLNVIEHVGGPLLQDVDLFDIYEGENLPEGMKSLAFRLTFQSREWTLSDREIGDIMAKIINAVRQEEWEVR